MLELRDRHVLVEQRAERGAAVGRARHHQAIRLVRCQRSRRPRPGARGNSRPARGERRGQVDAGQNALRAPESQRGRDPLGGRAHHAGQSQRRARARNRHGVPALFVVRQFDRRREHRARAADFGTAGDDPARIAEISRAYGFALEPDRPVYSLSAGERQRIEIARCLLQDPKVLILDEPTSVLTPQNRKSFSRRWSSSRPRAGRCSISRITWRK